MQIAKSCSRRIACLKDATVINVLWLKASTISFKFSWIFPDGLLDTINTSQLHPAFCWIQKTPILSILFKQHRKQVLWNIRDSYLLVNNCIGVITNNVFQLLKHICPLWYHISKQLTQAQTEAHWPKWLFFFCKMLQNYAPKANISTRHYNLSN